MNSMPVERPEGKGITALPIGIPVDLVFDDEPLEHWLQGAAPVAPTPASVLDLWERRLDRSAACARALAAVLARNPELIQRMTDLDGVEEGLRVTLESEPGMEGAARAARLVALGVVLELRVRSYGILRRKKRFAPETMASE